MWWGLAGRIAKWSLFVMVMAAVNSPEFYGMPDFTTICYEGQCFDAVPASLLITGHHSH